MKGLLLINLGTPQAPTTSAVRKYLRQFLSDPYVMDLHPVGRFLLVNALIVPFRSPRSAKAYASIWTREGSPLLVHTRNLGRKVQERLKEEFHVEIGMRYGEPSIETGIRALLKKNISELTLFPLYPQYALSSTETAISEAKRVLSCIAPKMDLKIIPSFYNQPLFIKAWATLGMPLVGSFKPDHVLFSFHGLPVRHVTKLDGSGSHCWKSQNCCDRIGPHNFLCYRAQCFQTAKGIAAALGADASSYTVSFQSRLGREEWITPYTDHVLPELAKRGVRKLAVFCPSFVADCLETLEEIGIRGMHSFKAHGGLELRLIPSLNDAGPWVEVFVEISAMV